MVPNSSQGGDTPTVELFRKEQRFMNVRQVVFNGPHKASLADQTLHTEGIAPTEILVQSEASLISQGTEGAAYQGLLMPGGAEQRYPQTPGYANVARVIETGSDD